MKEGYDPSVAYKIRIDEGSSELRKSYLISEANTKKGTETPR